MTKAKAKRSSEPRCACRICGEDAEQREAYAGLCKVCGQKREVYAARLLEAVALGALRSGPPGTWRELVSKRITDVFAIAEEAVAVDRHGKLYGEASKRDETPKDFP